MLFWETVKNGFQEWTKKPRDCFKAMRGNYCCVTRCFLVINDLEACILAAGPKYSGHP